MALWLQFSRQSSIHLVEKGTLSLMELPWVKNRRKKAWEVNMILLVFLFLPLFWCFQFRCSNGSSQHLILRLFRTYLALYLVQSDTKIHTHQVIFATVCRTFIVPLPASSLTVSSNMTDVFYHCRQNEKSQCLFDKIWMIPDRDDPDIRILTKYISIK